MEAIWRSCSPIGDEAMQARAMNARRIATLGLALALASPLDAGGVNPTWSIARQWDEEALQAIRLATPRPPVHARNLYHLSAAMYDAWAVYDPTARGVFVREKYAAADPAGARRTAISYAAYRVLKARFVAGNGPNVSQIQANLDALFLALGYDRLFTSTVGSSPAAIGNRIAAAVLAAGLADGSNEPGNYAPNNGYVPVNSAMPFKIPGCVLVNASRWQPLAFDFLVLQNGEVVGAAIQSAIGPHWNAVTPFSLAPADRNPANGIAFDQGPPPAFGTAACVADAVDLIARNAALDPSAGETIDLGLSVYRNSPLGSYLMPGHPVNPFTGRPYPSNPVPLADYGRAIAEHWADGPDSETPPGHWHVLANEVSDSPELERRIGGDGPELDRLEWDVKLYLALSGANHDAAISAWGMKGHYDSARPISTIRFMAELGQSSSASLPNYHPLGLPLVPGLIELVTEADVAPGGRFEDFPELVYKTPSGEPIGVNRHVGKVAVRGWLGGFNAGGTTGSTVTGPLPGHVYRSGPSQAWTIGGFALGTHDSPGSANPGQAALPSQVRINEIRIDQTGNDRDQYLEIAGPPNASLAGLTYLVIGDEVQTKVPDPKGRIQVAISLAGLNLGPDGLLVVAKPGFSLGTADATRPFTFRQIGTCTHALVAGFNGYLGQDLDWFEDGTLDFAPWTSVVDAVGLRRGTTGVGVYLGAAAVGPDNPRNQLHGVGWMLADRWMPYQASNFVTPPFPGYVSGHATFSRASAETLARFTGSPYFPGGIHREVVPAGSLAFEKGPSVDLELEYATYYDAADDAGVSRIFGGIHPRADDLPGRTAGSRVGIRAAGRAFALFRGLAVSPDLDGDGQVGPTDLASLLAGWGGASPGQDLDGSGSVGVEDLTVLLAAWGPWG
jgi:hypothetical protein